MALGIKQIKLVTEKNYTIEAVGFDRIKSFIAEFPSLIERFRRN